jgi:hypothetical protein
VNKIDKLTANISHQLPDEIDYNILLHLARACLCTEQPGPHQGDREASVIYEWTDIMGGEAARIRASPSDKQDTPPAPTQTHTVDPVSSRPGAPSRRTIAERRHPAAAMAPSDPKHPIVISAPVPAPAPPRADMKLPPSPPDSVTYTHTHPSTSPMTEPFPTLALHHPTPLSIISLGALLAKHDPPLPTGTTIDVSSSSTTTPQLQDLPEVQHATTRPSAIPPPLPTSTTTISNNSSLSRPPSSVTTNIRPLLRGMKMGAANPFPVGGTPFRPAGTGTPSRGPAAAGGGAGPGLASTLAELEEYNRLLQETSARHDTLLRQMGYLRAEMSAAKDGGRRTGGDGAAGVGVDAEAQRPLPKRWCASAGGGVSMTLTGLALPTWRMLCTGAATMVPRSGLVGASGVVHSGRRMLMRVWHFLGGLSAREFV